MLRYPATVILLGAAFFAESAQLPQERGLEETQATKKEPGYDDTFSGSIVEFSATKITVSRSILGKPAENRTFFIRPDTRVEGRLRVKTKVTVGFVTADEEDVARLIVVRTAQGSSPKKQ